MNEVPLAALEVTAQLAPRRDGVSVHLVPGGRTGAIPLRSPVTGKVACGLVVQPRFGWPGIGSILSEIGWYLAPEFIDTPLVPGSGREVPPWVLAGPVLGRLASLMRSMRRGYAERVATLSCPRGRILWDQYCSESLVRGYWNRLPCRFPELESDPRLRRFIRWTLERIYQDLVRVGAADQISAQLASFAMRLLESLSGVIPQMPSCTDLNLMVEHRDRSRTRHSERPGGHRLDRSRTRTRRGQRTGRTRLATPT
jgi:hypothetical protein